MEHYIYVYLLLVLVFVVWMPTITSIIASLLFITIPLPVLIIIIILYWFNRSNAGRRVMYPTEETRQAHYEEVMFFVPTFDYRYYFYNN